MARNPIPALQDPFPPLQVLLRWVAIVTILAQVIWQGGSAIAVLGVWGGLTLWNLILHGYLIFSQRRRWFLPWAVLVGDELWAALLFWLTGGFRGPLLWLPLLPSVLAALQLSLFQTALALLLTAVLFVGLGWLLDPTTLPIALAVVIAVGGMLLVIGWGVQRLRQRHLFRLHQRRLAQQRKERIERERIEAIYNLTTALTSTLNYQRVLDTALDMSASALMRPDSSSEQVVSAVLLFNEREELVVASSRRLTPADQRRVLPAATGILAQMVEEGDPRLFLHPERDPELSQFVAIRSCQVVYCYPLRTGLDVYGMFLFAHPEEGYFDAERQAILNIICKQASVALQNARLYHELEEEKERIMRVQEEARNKLARDLHDGPTQSVAAIAMRVNFARRMLERDPTKVAEELYRIEELARRTTTEIRHMLFTLRPLVLETQGLRAALEAMAEKMQETFGQNVIIQVDDALIEQLELNMQGVIFFIAEEAVNNARKHAQAEHIWVRLKPLRADIALLEIADDGVGFDVQAVEAAYEERGSLGMVNLKERSQLLNGVLQIHSAPGKGTRVQVFIPLSDEAAAELRHRPV